MDNFYYQKYLPSSRNGRMGYYYEQNDNMWRNMNYRGIRNENIENHQNEYLKLRNTNILNNNNNEESKKPPIDKIMKNFEKNGITSNVDKSDDNIPKYEKIIKRPKKINKKYISDHCVFCKNNNENEGMVRSHAVRDQYGRVICPKLRYYVCPLCQATGDNAHTIKYCPKKPIITMEQCQQIDTFFNKLYV